ncbi:hypothetical protein ACU4GD_04860 [Cupriavidus basilensis]
MEGEAIGAARCAVPAFPGSRAPDRTRTVNADGIRIAVHEWGEPDATPILLVHGALDFARTFDAFAPLLADGGYRGGVLRPARPRRFRACRPVQLGCRRARPASPWPTRSHANR